MFAGVRCIGLVFLLVSALPAQACETSFRSGLRAFARADALTREIEHRLYYGIGWASRSAVIERLEAASVSTTALSEINELQALATSGLRALDRSRRFFNRAILRCDLVNRQRAHDNLDAMTDTQSFLETHDAYLQRLAREVGGR